MECKRLKSDVATAFALWPLQLLAHTFWRLTMIQQL